MDVNVSRASNKTSIFTGFIPKKITMNLKIKVILTVKSMYFATAPSSSRSRKMLVFNFLLDIC